MSQIRVGLVGMRVQGALYLDAHVNARESGGHDASRQLHVYARQIARRLRRPVRQFYRRARNADGFAYDLWRLK